MVYERPPEVKRIDGDAHLAGANNQLVLLTRDRRYERTAGAGSIELSVGRSNVRPNPSDDLASIKISSKSDPDSDLGIDFGESQIAKPSLVGRADCIRLSARSDFKISAGKVYIVIDQTSITLDGEINLGEGAAERLLKGETFIRHYATHTHPSPNGPTGPVTQPVTEDVYSKRPVRVV